MVLESLSLRQIKFLRPSLEGLVFIESFRNPLKINRFSTSLLVLICHNQSSLIDVNHVISICATIELVEISTT